MLGSRSFHANPACFTRMHVRFFGQAGYGNVTESNDTSHYVEQQPRSKEDTEMATHEVSVDFNTENVKKQKAPPEVKEMRKKMRQGDQEAVRDYTASID